MLAKLSKISQVFSAALLLVSFTALADEPISFQFDMSAQQEAHEVTLNNGIEPTGSGTATYDPSTQELSFSLDYADLTGPAMASHFHTGPVGEEGDVVQTICGAPEPAILSACPSGEDGILSGTWENVSADQVSELKNGEIFINIHTANNPAGELRSQLVPNQ